MIDQLIEEKLSVLTNAEELETMPFSELLTARRLLWIFGPNSDGNEISLLQGIFNIQNFNNEQKLFVKLLGDPSSIDINGQLHKRPQYYEFEAQNIDCYYQNNDIQFAARIVFSTSMDWLLLITFDGYSLLGAKSNLMKKIEDSIPTLSQFYNYQDFISYWESLNKENGIDITWVEKLLTHIDK